MMWGVEKPSREGACDARSERGLLRNIHAAWNIHGSKRAAVGRIVVNSKPANVDTMREAFRCSVLSTNPFCRRR